MKNSIEIRGLHKSYGSVKAVCDLSFSVGEGQLFAFLGLQHGKLLVYQIQGFIVGFSARHTFIQELHGSLPGN